MPNKTWCLFLLLLAIAVEVQNKKNGDKKKSDKKNGDKKKKDRKPGEGDPDDEMLMRDLWVYLGKCNQGDCRQKYTKPPIPLNRIADFIKSGARISPVHDSQRLNDNDVEWYRVKVNKSILNKVPPSYRRFFVSGKNL